MYLILFSKSNNQLYPPLIMKVTILFSLFFLASVLALAQTNESTNKSVIHKNNGEEIDAIIIEITETEVRYRTFDNQLGPNYVLQKSSIFKIVFPNGKEEVYFGKTFTNEQNKNIKGLEVVETPQNTGAPRYSSQEIKDFQFQAIRDANQYYEPRGVWVATSLTTFFFWPAGIITTVATSLTPPAMHRLNIRDNKLLDNPYYFDTYKHTARQMKSRKAWTGFGIGAGAFLLLLLVTSTP